MLIVRVRHRLAADFVNVLRNMTAAVDPRLQLHELQPVSESRRVEQRALRMFGLGLVLTTASVLLLSVAGVYAMMSFTVARRRREIGIRSALGADPRRLLIGIFTRASAQLGTGVAVGLAVAIALELLLDGVVMGGRPQLVLPAVAGIVAVVGLLAALGPARRGLAIQPTEALRAE
jgi:ABC-type antimicrobial peptide transport system permease subunit